MKLMLAALAATLTLGAAPVVQAQEASPLSFNVSLTTDYRYRGISQTRLRPAVQGGIDYAHDSGFYVGAWGSSIKWIKDAGGDADVEIDVYGGYKTELTKGVALDVGVLTYNYPKNKLHPSANTQEIYGALTLGPATLKYSHSVSNLFGFADSKNSQYLEAAATIDLFDGYTITPHVGYQRVKNNSDFSYTDYSVTVNKEFAGFVFGLTAVITDTEAYVYAPKNKNLGKDAFVFSVKKTF
ncbi:MAG TPA: TorF family putative porin [Roseateles sp.]|nr:TorF family putative porin [Roseateles sp.]